jgi:hypothetical protein
VGGHPRAPLAVLGAQHQRQLADEDVVLVLGVPVAPVPALVPVPDPQWYSRYKVNP